jgi:hypothetical protein
MRNPVSMLFLLLAIPLARGAAQEQDRWQLTLASGEYMYELQPQALEGDMLVVRQEGVLRKVPLARITELRRVQKTVVQPAGGRRGGIRDLVGADDLVFQMTLLSVDEKRELVREILRQRSKLAGRDT